jgi:mRNA-degrading endonuclease RelE of RelBE toxin-antitoxin system
LVYKIEYKSSVYHDLKRLDKHAAKRILKDLEETLTADPNAGIPPSGQFRGLFKLRIDDYRVIYSKTGDGVLILRIGPRGAVYDR